MRPSVTGSRPAIIINSVLLPQPLGPSRQTNSPFSMANVAVVTASNAAGPFPNTLRTRWQLISAGMPVLYALPRSFAYFPVLARTESHSAADSVTLPMSLLLQKVSAFGGSRSFGAEAYCFTMRACSSILARSE